MDYREACARHGIPAAAIVTFDLDGRLEVTECGADEGGCRVYDTASLTKPVFARAVLSLAEEGFSLDTPLADFRGGVPPVDDPLARKITARDVLCHRSGLPNWLSAGHTRLLAAPGATFTYSGEAYTYLQRVVEAYTGQGLEDFLRSHVFGEQRAGRYPLEWDSYVVANLCPPHDAAGKPLPLRRREPMAAGTLCCSAADYAQLFGEFLADRRAFEAMTSPHVQVADGVYFGMGLAVADSIVFAWGDNPGYKHLVCFDQQAENGLVVFTNSDRGALLYLEVSSELFPKARGLDWLGAFYR